jgi:hypothetical protein
MLLPTLGLLTAVRGCCDQKAGLRVGNRTLLPITCEAIVGCRARKVLRRQALTQLYHVALSTAPTTLFGRNGLNWDLLGLVC